MASVKRTLPLLLALFVAVPLVADERVVKKQLIAELVELLDPRTLMQASFDLIMGGVVDERRAGVDMDELSDTDRAAWEAQQKKEVERMQAFRERLLTRIDYVKFIDEVYVPMLDDRFTAGELRELIAFFKTKAGHKTARLLPELGIGSMVKGMRLINEASDAAQEELAREDAAKHPWKRALSDLRTLATALEARATDTNEYPTVAFEDLEPLLTPTYLRVMPKVDPWGTPYLYLGNGENYRFVSAGADKRFEWASRQIDPSWTEPKYSESADTDIIFQNGSVIQAPKEMRGQ
jgi:hypothetical protein